MKRYLYVIGQCCQFQYLQHLSNFWLDNLCIIRLFKWIVRGDNEKFSGDAMTKSGKRPETDTASYSIPINLCVWRLRRQCGCANIYFTTSAVFLQEQG